MALCWLFGSLFHCFVTITHPFAAELTFQACYNIIADFKQFLVILGCFGLGMTYFTMSWGLFWGSAMTWLGPLSLFMHKNSFWRPLQSINLQIGAKTSKKYKVKIPKFFQSNFSVVVYKMRHLILWLLNIVLEANKWILAKNLIFGHTQPARFGLVYVPWKITKNGAKRPKIPKISKICIHMIKIIANHVWKFFGTFSGFFGHFAPFFDFSPKNNDFSKKIS